ncbi:hypothetical protein O988_04942 [Pseudogymnoascus sp. VKM F-3808]|nr:hypothetical protein O988_04942 [Pseudogymnoascus sp. VKM F-3808]
MEENRYERSPRAREMGALQPNGGLLFLDAPITFLLPELFETSLLTGFNFTGAPEFNKPETEVTVTMKVSHQSGAGNIIVHPYSTKLQQP